MPRIIIVFLFFTVCAKAQKVELNKVVDGKISFTIFNDLENDLILDFHNGRLIFLNVELWRASSGVRLRSKDAVEINRRGGFVAFDEIVLKPKEIKKFNISLKNFSAYSKKNNEFLSGFFKYKKEQKLYSVRISVDIGDVEYSSMRKKISK